MVFLCKCRISIEVWTHRRVCFSWLPAKTRKIDENYYVKIRHLTVCYRRIFFRGKGTIRHSTFTKILEANRNSIWRLDKGTWCILFILCHFLHLYVFPCCFLRYSNEACKRPAQIQPLSNFLLLLFKYVDYNLLSLIFFVVCTSRVWFESTTVEKYDNFCW